MSITQKLNHLRAEKSPYLQQHAYNPVDWYPWGEEAFQKARDENKPIFLSIGYSTCHWCHVMERESFENESIAAFLNEHFISIKLDREERPDIDAIYMTATQAMTGSGGWPMTVMLTPELKPFFCGTYFPPIPKYGKPSFKQLLERIREVWETQHQEVIRSSEALTEAIEQEATASTPTPLTTALESALAYFERTFDREYGGFGSAPKFPRASQFDFLFHYYSLTGNDEARTMALHTLDAMAAGGIFDHLGGGFHRYSVDRYWLVSHFEKMLYDQAQLVNSYLDGYQVTENPLYANIVRSTCEFVLREMTHPDGGFYSALDADSEGEEGTYYVWTKTEIEEAVGTADAEIFFGYSDITEAGNWEHGKNVIFVTGSITDIAEKLSLSVNEVRKAIHRVRKKLFELRSKRIRPHLDDKILASWNGFMIGAMARAGSVLGEEKYLEAAKRAADFVWEKLFIDTKEHLLHRWRDGESRFDASLDSYAFLIKGLLDYAEASLDMSYVEKAITLQLQQDELLYDSARGGYFTSRESSDVIVRTKNTYDGAEPSGSSVSVVNLLRLHTITMDDTLLKRAEKTLEAFSAQLNQYPYTMPAMLSAFMWLDNPPAQFVFTGSKAHNEHKSMRWEIEKVFLPIKVIFHNGSDVVSDFSRSLQATDKAPTLYYCHDGTCELPITAAEGVKSTLSEIAKRKTP